MIDPVLRILDANFNRAGEALRTLEEHARFIAGSAALTARVKQLRHMLAGLRSEVERALPPHAILADSRDIRGDAGAGVKTETEAEREDAGAVLKAALRRAAESLRVLSEYGKVENAALGDGFEKMRYELYALEPLLLADADLRSRLRQALLYVLVTGELSSCDALTAAREAVAGGADIIQMREKTMGDGEFYQLALAMAEVCRDGGALFLVNDRPHIAALVDASGIHGGQGDLPVHLARRIIGYGKLIGRSTSAPEFAEKAVADGADYIGVGPVYETKTKAHRKAVGLDYVSWAARWGKLPFFAIGSVNRSSIDAVLEAGARGVAICTGVTMAKDIAAEAAYYKKKLLDCQHG